MLNTDLRRDTFAANAGNMVAACRNTVVGDTARCRGLPSREIKLMLAHEMVDNIARYRHISGESVVPFTKPS